MIITAIYDKRGRTLNRINLYENRIIAYRDYYMQIERMKSELKFIDESDYALLEFGYIFNNSDMPVIDAYKEAYEITKDEIEDYLLNHELNFGKYQKDKESK